MSDDKKTGLKPIAPRGRAAGGSAAVSGNGQGKPPRVAVMTINRPDRAHRSIPPGGPRDKTYARNIVAETFAARYGQDAREDMAAEAAAQDLDQELANPSVRDRLLGGGRKTVRPGRKKGFFGL